MTSTASTGPGHHLPPVTETEPALVQLLTAWLPGRRWFPAKEAVAEVTSIGTLTLDDPMRAALVRIVLLRARSSSVDVVLQVPVTLREAGTAPERDTLIGAFGVPSLEVHDGCGDPAFLRAWIAAASGPDHGTLRSPLLLETEDAHVVTGEQSNTSVVIPGQDGGAILKVFRALSPGLNPEIELPSALAGREWWHVPEPLGWLEATWGDASGPGQLSVLSRFVPDAEDGFELACAVAGRGESFAPLAEELGVVIAEMHTVLATALPVASDVVPVGPTDIADAVRARFRWARGIVPALDAFAAAVEQTAARVEALPTVPPVQRIHGDLHLGQALRARGTWYVTDFEGEPLAPIATRSRPDLALRDVAGVLRSLDYAAAVGHADEDWTMDARVALLRGYGSVHGAAPGPGNDGSASPLEGDLLRAVELERALYEAVYEARNRPAWSRIPAIALERLLGPVERSDGPH